MRNLILAAGLLTLCPAWFGATAAPAAIESVGWQARVSHELPLMGHRNWILIVDSAYPLQSAPGVETVSTGADGVEVLKYVLGAIRGSIHVRPDIFMDAELPFVQEEDAPGTSFYRDTIAKIFDGVTINSQPHEQLIHQIDQSSNLVHVLVLKTRMAIPYSSVFIRLNCKYWGDDAEERLRARMGPPEPPSPPAQTPPQNQQPAPGEQEQPAPLQPAQPSPQSHLY